MAEIYLAFHETDLAKQYYESAKKKAAKAENADGSVSAAGLDATSARLERLGKKIEEESKGK
jgi:hypothetical protein